MRLSAEDSETKVHGYIGHPVAKVLIFDGSTGHLPGVFPVFTILLAHYKDVFLTTIGAFRTVEVPDDGLFPDDVSVTYASQMGTELPVNWADMLWSDDTGKVQKLSKIDLEYINECNSRNEDVTRPCFTMADGTKSWGVTSVNRHDG